MQALFGMPYSLLPAFVKPEPILVSGQLWVDASNWTGEFTDQMMADLKAAHVTGIIVQAITGLNGVSYTSQQCQKAADWGFLLMAYVWAFPDESPASIDTRLSMLNGKPVRKIWVDLEQAGLTPADVRLILMRCDMRLPGTGIYSGKWFWDQQGWGAYWPERDLWDAQPHFTPYGGWTKPVVQQTLDDVVIGSVHSIDEDVIV